MHRGQGRQIANHPKQVSSSTELAWRQADANYRYYLGVINEDRQARGLPLIEI
jgi:hypothetical protein